MSESYYAKVSAQSALPRSRRLRSGAAGSTSVSGGSVSSVPSEGHDWFDRMFELVRTDDDQYFIRAKYDFCSVGQIAAMGIGTTADAGGNIGGISLNGGQSLSPDAEGIIHLNITETLLRTVLNAPYGLPVLDGNGLIPASYLPEFSTLTLGETGDTAYAGSKGAANAAAISVLQGYFTSGVANNARQLDGHDASYFATASALAAYLPMSGGNITGGLHIKDDFADLLVGRRILNGEEVFAPLFIESRIPAGSEAVIAPLYLQHDNQQGIVMCYGGGNVSIGNYETDANYRLRIYGNARVDANLVLGSSLTPVTAGAQDLGAAGSAWRALYVNKLYIGGSSIEYDAGNGALRINGNAYATGGLSTCGVGAGAAQLLQDQIDALRRRIENLEP